MRCSAALSALFAGMIALAGCAEKPRPSAGDAAGEGAKESAAPRAKPGRIAVAKLPEDRASIERILPEGTIAYLSVDDPAGAHADIMKTALGRILTEEEVLTFLGKPLGQLAKVMAQVEKIYGASLDDIRRAFAGQLAVALVKLGPGAGREPDYAVLAAARLTDADAAGRVFDWAVGTVTSAMPPDALRNIGTAGWRGVVLPLDRDAELSVALGEGLVAVTIANPGDETLHGLMAAASRTPARSLALSAEYEHVVSRLGAERIWTFFLSGDRLREALLAIGRKEDPEGTKTAERVIDKLGLRSVHGIGASWAAEPPGIVQRTYVHAPAPRKGLLALASEEPLGDGTLRLAHGELLSFTAASFKFASAMELVRGIALALDESEKLTDALAQAREALGMDIETDLLRHLGDEVAFIIVPPEVGGMNPLLGGVGGISVVVELRNADAFSGTLEKLLAMADAAMQSAQAGSMGELAYLGTRLRYARFLGGTISPTVAVAGDRLIVAGSLSTAKELVRLCLKGDAEPLVQSDEFKALLVHVGGRVGPSLIYSDTKQGVTTAVSLAGLRAGIVGPIMARGRPTPAAGGPLELGRFTDWVDLALLPSPRSLTRHLFPQIGTSIVDDDGFLAMNYGPMGGLGMPSLTGTSGAAVIAAIAIPNLLASKMVSNEAAAIAGMRAYLGAQNTFHRTDFYGKGALVYANPKDGRGFPDLYEVGGEKIKLIDEMFAKATVDGTPKAGYYFADLEYDDYAIDCGLCAAPAAYNSTGRNIFIIDVMGTIYQMDATGTYPGIETGDRVKPLTKYPSTKELQTRWLPVE